MNKTAKVAGWVWILIIVGAVVVWQGGYLDSFLKPAAPTPTPNVNVAPSTGLTAITINTKDALTATDTNANVSYYIFTKDGKLYTSGTTSAGTATKNVAFGQDYDVIAFSDSTYYPVKGSFSATSAAPTPLTLGLNAVSNATVSVSDDVTGTTTNISVGLGAQTGFKVYYYVTTASASVFKPVIVVDVNQTSVQGVSMVGLSTVTCPTRLTSSAGRVKYCFQADSLTKASGTVIAKGSILFSSSTTPSTSDVANVTIIDTQAYLDPNFVAMSGYHEGTENANTHANVGASDSADRKSVV